MYAWHPPRALSAASSVAIVALIGVLLLLGLRAQQVIRQSPSPISLTLSPQPQPTERPKPPEARHVDKPAPKHEASPRNFRNEATQVVVSPVQPPIVPPPVVTAGSARGPACCPARPSTIILPTPPCGSITAISAGRTALAGMAMHCW